jgi:hypothetical protein
MPINQITQATSDSLKKADPESLRALSDGCFVAGFASIAASIAIWAVKREETESAHAERFGIFVGLWAPTFFILSNRFERYAERAEAEKAKTPSTGA